MPTSGTNVAGRYWSLHTHSRHSVDDALSPVGALVERAVELGYPALGLTDHGTMAGVQQLYVAGKKHDLPVAPGVELYITPDHGLREQRSMHVTLAAYTTEGYRNLVGLHNQAQRQTYYRPRLDFGDLAQAAYDGRTQGIALATGCRSGAVVRALTERGPAEAQKVVEAYAAWFPRVYVELMNHHFTADGMSDSAIFQALVDIAARTGIPTILTGDAHYTVRAEREAHDALKTLVSFSTDPTEGRFNGEGYWLYEQHEVFGDFYDEGAEGLDDLASRLKVTIPELDTFSLKIPDVTLKGDADAELERRTMDALGRFIDGFSDAKATKYVDRVVAELEVIRVTEMAPYLLLVNLICSFMEEQGIWFYARGSVAGSLVCHLLHITNVDSVAWDIRMDRFLSGDRTSPPDVDLDIEHTRRDEVTAMLEERGYELVQVGTHIGYGLDAKVTDEGEEERGSLRVKYFATLKKQGIEMAWEQVPAEDKATLRDLAGRDLIKGTGAHPGGYVVARDKPTVACLPLVQIGSSGTFVTAFDKGEVEAMGFPKIDLLGSKVLTAIKNCSMQVTGLDEREARAFWRSIPLNDKKTLQRIGEGKTAGLFQLSGWTNRKVCMDIKPKRTLDVVAVQALGRPSPMKSGFTDEFMKRRTGTVPIPVMHTDIAQETKDTYGLAIYQEQVVGMLRRIGVEPIPLTKLLKAVKASGKQHVEQAKATVAEALAGLEVLARARGWSDTEWAYLRDCLVQYGAGYSFGKAHSVTYGKAAYDTAWLATHHPLSFWTGMLNAYLGSKNSKGDALEPIYWKAARQDDVRVVAPHVNTSELGYVPDLDKSLIRKGLVSVSGVGQAAAARIVANRPYGTVQEFLQRSGCPGSKDLWTVDLAEFTTRVDACNELGDPKYTNAVFNLARAGALDDMPYGDPIRKAVQRRRKCQPCKTTFPTPLEYEDHCDAEHGGQYDPPKKEKAA